MKRSSESEAGWQIPRKLTNRQVGERFINSQHVSRDLIDGHSEGLQVVMCYKLVFAGDAL